MEPDLDGRSLRNIKNGNTIEIFLEPKTPGTYLNGEFIPAFDYSPPIGSDLEEAEKQWDLEEELNEWVDGENQKFNKDKF